MDRRWKGRGFSKRRHLAGRWAKFQPRHNSWRDAGSYNLICGRPDMAGGADRRGVVRFVAAETNAHGRDAGCFGHSWHFLHLSVTHLAFHSRVQVRAMRPSNSGKNFVDAHPGDRLLGFGKLGELLNGRFFGRNRYVAGHARACRRERHEVSRRGIGVAIRALQPDCEMRLMAVRQRLIGRRVFERVVRNFLLYRRARSCLLLPGTPSHAKWHDKKSSV